MGDRGGTNESEPLIEELASDSRRPTLELIIHVACATGYPRTPEFKARTAARQ